MKTTQEAILADYHKFEYGEQVVDPYKVLIYKIIGRCELYKKSSSALVQTTEDYIWLQVHERSNRFDKKKTRVLIRSQSS